MECRGEGQARDTYLVVIHVQMLFKAIRLGKVIKTVNVNRKGRRSEDLAQYALQDEEEPAKEETEKEKPVKVEGNR